MAKSKRTPIPATRDTFVHYLFGTPGHEFILLSFINAVLQSFRIPLIKSLEVLNPFNPATFDKDKYTTLDIKATNKSGKLFAIEFQTCEHTAFIDRILFIGPRFFPSRSKKAKTTKSCLKSFVLLLQHFACSVSCRNY